jgi:MFS family permease
MRRVIGGDRGLRRAVVALCVTEITSWGVLYYALPVAAGDITATEGWTHGQVFTAFSTGLLVSAVAGAGVGRLLDRFGPRPVMTVGSLVGVLGLLLVASAPNLPVFFAAWLVTGMAQSAALYPPAFAAITRWYGEARTWPLTVLTLVGGLASTVFAPVTHFLVEDLGWRSAFLVLTVVYALVTIPLHAIFLTPPWPGHMLPAGGHHERRQEIRSVVRSGRFLRLQVSMTLTAVGMYAVTLNLIPLLTSRGIGPAFAATVFGLVGAGQVMGRVVFAVLPSGREPYVRTLTIGTASVLVLTLLALLPGPAPALVAAAILAGAVRGAFTLLQATAVSDRWGTQHFGALNGTFTVPLTAAIALAPAAGAWATDLLGGQTAAVAGFAVLTAVGVLVGRRA